LTLSVPQASHFQIPNQSGLEGTDKEGSPPKHSSIAFHLHLQTGQISFSQKFARNVKKQPTHIIILTFISHFP
jgi:hypothetical protein